MEGETQGAYTSAINGKMRHTFCVIAVLVDLVHPNAISFARSPDKTQREWCSCPRYLQVNVTQVAKFVEIHYQSASALPLSMTLFISIIEVRILPTHPASTATI
jgi:hypothetical protein